MGFVGHYAFRGEIDTKVLGKALPRDEQRSARAEQWQFGHIVGLAWSALPDLSYAEEKDIATARFALFWGRLYNRLELTRQLDLESGASEAELLVSAYKKWGADFLEKFYGDFSCLLWDGANQLLILGRDFLGRYPLVFYPTPEGVFFAAEPEALLNLPVVPKEVDDWYMSQALMLTRQYGEHTALRGVRRVLPGHTTRITPQQIQSRRYWFPERVAPVLYRQDQDYADGMRERMDQAVRERLPRDGLVSTTLSSGLDSASVTCLAARALAEQGRPLLAFTAVPHRGVPNPAHGLFNIDEWPVAHSVCDKYSNIEHIAMQNDAMDFCTAAEIAARYELAPTLAGFNSTWWRGIMRAASERNSATLLLGTMGNATVSYSGEFALQSLWQRGQYGELLSSFFSLRQQGMSWRTLTNWLLVPYAPQWLRRLGKRAANKEAEPLASDFSMMNPDFARQYKVDAEVTKHRFNLKRHCRTGLALRMYLMQGIDVGIAHAANQRLCGVRPSDPLADRRLVEWCLAIPEEQYILGGVPRSLLQRAMAGIVPREILSARVKGRQSGDWLRTLQQNLSSIHAALIRVERSAQAKRMLDLPRIRTLLETLPRDPRNLRHIDAVRYLGVARAVTAGIFILHVESLAQIHS